MPPSRRPNDQTIGGLDPDELHLRSRTGIRSRTGMTGSLSMIRRTVLIYPGILLMLFVLLVAAGVSGSSVAMLSDHARDPGLLLGSPQPVREDEWSIHTPDFIGEMMAGGRSPRLVGVGEHDLTVIGNLPTRDWSAAFRPDSMAAIVLPPANALAWNWWFPVLISALAFYGLAGLCGLGPGLSVSLSMLISFSPFVEWWHSTSIAGALGFGAAACFSIVRLLRAESRSGTFFWCFSSFYWIVAFTLVLYPPFQISTLLALIPITVAVILADIRGKRYSWPRALALTGTAGLAAMMGVAAFVFTHREAISALQGTTYPGLRLSKGGEGTIIQLLSANFSPVLAHAPAVFDHSNLSEISAPYVFAAESLVVVLLAGWRIKDRTARYVAIASAAALTLGLAWDQLPIPSWAGRFFMLTTVPSQRVLPLIGIPSAFLLAVLIHSQIPQLSRRRRILVGVAVASTSLGLAMIEVVKLKAAIPSLSISALVAVAVLGAVTVAVLAAAPRRWGVAAVVTLVACGFLSVNPLYRGTGALENSDLSQAIRREGPNATWVNYGNQTVEAFLAASGASSLSGRNYYPNAEGWKQFLGGPRDKDVWNRYLKTQWFDGANRAKLDLAGNDWGLIHISPCSPALTTFGVTHVIAPVGTFHADDSCLHKITSVVWQKNRYNIYARSS
jgi:hypothetical protein